MNGGQQALSSTGKSEMKVRPWAGGLTDWMDEEAEEKEGELKARVRSGCGVQGEERVESGVNGVKGGLGIEMMSAGKERQVEGEGRIASEERWGRWGS